MMDDIFGVHIHFILTDDHTVVPVNYQEYIDWQMKRGNLGPVRVGFANIKDGVDVSTVFLGLNHQHDPDGSPLVFETMVMGGVRDGWMDRYSTWAQAAKGHAKTVMQVRQEEFKESGK